MGQGDVTKAERLSQARVITFGWQNAQRGRNREILACCSETVRGRNERETKHVARCVKPFV